VDPITVVPYMTKMAVAGAIVSSLALLALAYFRKEDRGYVSETTSTSPVMGGAETLKGNYVMAMVPVLPLALIFVGAQPAFKAWGMNVPASMLIGTMIALLVSRKSSTDVTKAFFEGMGKAYGDVMGIIIAAGVFTASMILALITAYILASM
jgi:C4-dicarboxylate transporter, DcuC family